MRLMNTPATTATPPWAGYASLALSMALVGSYVALSKPLMVALPVFLLAWLRFAIGALAMLPWLRRPPEEAPQDRQTRWLLFLQSLLGNFGFSICMLYGVQHAGAAAAGVVMASIPAAVAALSWLFLRERIGVRTLLAIALACGGIALMAIETPALPSSASPADALPRGHTLPWLGHLLLGGAVLCEAAYAVIGKRLSGCMTPRRIAAVINLWGLALTTPLALLALGDFKPAAMTPALWLLLVFYSLAASVWTVWLWMTGLRSVPAAQSGVFTVMLPVTATLVGVGWLGEHISGLQTLALCIALASIVLATLPARRAPDH